MYRDNTASYLLIFFLAFTYTSGVSSIYTSYFASYFRITTMRVFSGSKGISTERYLVEVIVY